MSLNTVPQTVVPTNEKPRQFMNEFVIVIRSAKLPAFVHGTSVSGPSFRRKRQFTNEKYFNGVSFVPQKRGRAPDEETMSENVMFRMPSLRSASGSMVALTGHVWMRSITMPEKTMFSTRVASTP